MRTILSALAVMLLVSPVQAQLNLPPPLPDLSPPKLQAFPEEPKAALSTPPAQACGRYEDSEVTCSSGFYAYCPSNNRCYRDWSEARQWCPGRFYTACGK